MALVPYKPKHGGKMVRNSVKTTTVVTKSKSKRGYNKRQHKTFKHSRTLANMFPAYKIVPLVWTNAIGISSGVTQSNFGVATQMFINDILHPLATSPVNSVQGYDQIAPIYNKYKVHGCYIEVTVSNPINTTTPSNGADGLYVGIRMNQSTGYIGIYGEKIGTAAMKKWTVIKPLNDSGSQVVTYRRYFSIAAIEGLSKLQFKADISDYNAGISSYPSKRPFIEVACSNSHSSDNYQCVVSTKLTMITTLYDRATFATSII